MPQIANFCGKVFYRAKRLFSQLKASLKEAEKELGIGDLKNEMQRGIAEEKTRFEDETTIIVDLYGNEHLVPNLHEVRPELGLDAIKQEVAQLNEENSKQKNS